MVTRVVSAAPDLALALAFLTTWLDPHRFGDGMVFYLMIVMLLEFFVVHSAAFMGAVIIGGADRTKKTISILALGGFYTLLIGAFGLMFKTWWPLGAFWLLTLNRLLGVLLGQAPTEQEKKLVQASWGVGVLLYIMLGLATTMLYIPSLGITKAVITAQHLPGSGLWVDEPQRVLAFGVLYFLSVALVELNGYAWVVKAFSQERDARALGE